MAEDTNESTRVMPAAGSQDRTMVAQLPSGAAATQMGTTVACAVCGSQSPALETYCGECGFLLSSAPGVTESTEEAPMDGPELVEAGSGRRFPLRPGTNLVGREGGDVLLMDGTVSRRHAQIELQDGAVTVTDLGSTNGTFVDSERISASTPTPAQPGATLRFGNATLVLVLPGREPLGEASAAAEATQVITPDSPPSESAEAESVAAAVAPEPVLAPEEAGDEQAIAQLKPVEDGGSVITIYEGTNTIGRRSSNSIVISGDPYVSGRHAEITCDNSGCYITDLGSTNGTVVNGTKLIPDEKQLLLDGDEVTIGRSAYRFENIEIEMEETPAEGAQPASAATEDKRSE